MSKAIFICATYITWLENHWKSISLWTISASLRWPSSKLNVRFQT